MEERRVAVALPLRNQSPCWLSKWDFTLVLRPSMPNLSIYSLEVAMPAAGGAGQDYILGFPRGAVEAAGHLAFPAALWLKDELIGTVIVGA